MSATEALVAALALIAGATGTWSPCGFSAIESLGPCGHTGSRSKSTVAAAAFALGALAGGVLTFGLLGLLGGLLGGGSSAALAAGVAIALAAAAGELAGVRVIPQIRRQVPERWRHRLPLVMVGAGYGLLLGLGFTTFVLTFGVWALAGIVLVTGDAGLGLAAGVAFGAGRALPVVLVAPLADRPSGRAVLAAMAERPATYRAFRLANAAALSLVGLAAISTGAIAKRDSSERAYDPSALPGELAYERPGRSAVLLKAGGQRRPLAGTDPAIGGPWLALVRGRRIELFERRRMQPTGGFGAPGADALAVTSGFLVWRTRTRGRDRILARPIHGGGPGAALGEVKRLAAGGRSSQLGRPSIDGRRAVWAHAQRRRNRIMLANLERGGKRVVRQSNRIALQNPSIEHRAIAYVTVQRRKSVLRLTHVGRSGQGKRIYTRRRGLIWSTDLTAKRVFATVRAGGGWRVSSFRR